MVGRTSESATDNATVVASSGGVSISGPLDAARGIAVEIRVTGAGIQLADVEAIHDYIYLLAAAFADPASRVGGDADQEDDSETDNRD